MKITKMLVSKDKKNHPNQKLKGINYITIHTTGNYNSTANAENHAKYLNNGSGGKEVSFHYAVDSDSIFQMFDDDARCWHAGDGNNGTGNSESIGIEICVHDKIGFVKACENAACLTADLILKHGLTLDRVKRHKDWSGKNCPKELIEGKWGITWAEFLKLVEEKIKPSVAVEKPVKKEELYKVQVGAFKIKSNADKYCKELISKGIDAFVVKM